MARWRALLTIAVAGLGAVVPAAAAQAAPTLLGQWSLDGSYEDGASDVTPDGAGNALGLKAPVGGVHLGSAGARFGTGGTLATNVTPMQVTSPVLAPEQVTLLAWVRQSGFPGSLRYVAGRGDDALTCGGSSYAIYTGYPGMEGLRFYVRYANTSALSDAAPQAVFDGGWHLIAGTYDGTALRFYVDGALVGVPKAAPGPLNYALGGGSSFYVDGYAVPGCSFFNDADDWPGAIDDVRVYDRALSAAELTRLATSTGPAAPLLISDESLVVTPPAPGPAEAQQPTASAQQQLTPAGPKLGTPVPRQALEKAVDAVEGVSASKAPTKALESALAASQAQALAALGQPGTSSYVGLSQVAKELSAKDAKAVKPDERIQARLGAMRYGIDAEVPAERPGQVVQAVATLVVETKSGGKVRTQQITLPPSAGIAGPGGKVDLQFPVDQKATAAMTKETVAKAAIAVQAAALDSLSELGETDSVRLQMILDRRSKFAATVSNILQKVSDVQQQITANLRGGLSQSERKEQDELKSKAAKLEREVAAAERDRDKANAEAAQSLARLQQMRDLIKSYLDKVAQGQTGAGLMPTASGSVAGCRTCGFAAQASN